MRGRPARAWIAAVLLAVAGCAPIRPPATVEQPITSDAARLASFQPLSGYGTARPSSIDQLPVTYADAAGRPATASVIRLVFPDSVFFDTGSDVPLPASESVLDVVAQNLRRDAPAGQLTVVGHTDSVGGDAYNLDLSRRRATRVIAAVASRAVDAAELSAVAMGRNQPVAANDTDAGRARNRRVEFYLSTDLRANEAAIAATPETLSLLGADAAPVAQATLFRLQGDIGTIPLTVVAAAVAPPPLAALPSVPPRILAAPRPRPAASVPIAKIRPVMPAPAPNLKPVLPDAVAPAPLGPPQTF